MTGKGSFDCQSLRDKLVTRVSAATAECGVPCVVLAGDGPRQLGVFRKLRQPLAGKLGDALRAEAVFVASVVVFAP
jgi:hypothetical protein